MIKDDNNDILGVLADDNINVQIGNMLSQPIHNEKPETVMDYETIIEEFLDFVGGVVVNATVEVVGGVIQGIGEGLSSIDIS